jgi:hypothetical protein
MATQILPTLPKAIDSAAGRATAVELFPLLTGKTVVSEAPVSLQKYAGQTLKRKMHYLHLVPPREAMDHSGNNIYNLGAPRRQRLEGHGYDDGLHQ